VTEIDTSRERIEHLRKIGCADYLHEALLARAEAAEAERDKLREALTPSGETKAAYMGEVECDCPTETWRHYVPWTSVKAVMAMIRARAALKGSDT
jgi:hypothetical protein